MQTTTSEQRAALNAALAPKPIDWARAVGNQGLPPHAVGADPGDNDFAPHAVITVRGNNVYSFTFSQMGSVMRKKEDREAIFHFLSGVDNREAIADSMCAEIKKTVWRDCRLFLLGDGSPRETGNACSIAEMLSPGWGSEIAKAVKDLCPDIADDPAFPKLD